MQIVLLSSSKGPLLPPFLVMRWGSAAAMDSRSSEMSFPARGTTTWAREPRTLDGKWAPTLGHGSFAAVRGVGPLPAVPGLAGRQQNKGAIAHGQQFKCPLPKPVTHVTGHNHLLMKQSVDRHSAINTEYLRSRQVEEQMPAGEGRVGVLSHVSSTVTHQFAPLHSHRQVSHVNLDDGDVVPATPDSPDLEEVFVEEGNNGRGDREGGRMGFTRKHTGFMMMLQ